MGALVEFDPVLTAEAAIEVLRTGFDFKKSEYHVNQLPRIGLIMASNLRIKLKISLYLVSSEK